MNILARLNEKNTISKMKRVFTCLVLGIISLSVVITNSAFASDKKPLNKMVQLETNALHLMSMGEGDYTVIFESGFGNDLTHWRRVAPQISKSGHLFTCWLRAV